MKKALVLILTLFVFASASLFAMGGSESSSGKVDMLLWLPPNGSSDSFDMEFWTVNLAPWAEANNVNLEIEIVPWGEYETKYLTGFASGDGPDVGYMYLEMINDYIDMGLLEDLDSYFTEEEKANYLYYDQGHIKGGQYMLPFIVGNASFYVFNMDILAQAGITELPTTWGEFIDVLQAVKDLNLPGVIPFAQSWGEPAIGALNYNFYPFFWQAGGELFNEEGTKFLLSEGDAGLRTAELLYDLRFTYGFVTDECLALTNSGVKEQFIAGRTAVAGVSGTSASQLDASGINWEYVDSFNDVTRAVWVACDALVMNSASKHKDLAASLMKYMTTGEMMTKYHTQVASFPPITVDEEYNDHPKLRQIYENAEQLHTMQVASSSASIADHLYRNLQLMMLGDLTPQQVITNTQNYADSVMK